MSLFFERRGAERRDQSTVAFAEMRDARMSGSWTGVPVTPEAVLGIPAVWACTQLTAGIISQLPFDEFRPLPDGGRLEVTPSKLLTAPSADLAAEDWRFCAIESAQLHGTAYGAIVSRDATGWEQQIELLHPSRIQCRVDPVTRQLAWKVDNAPFPANDMWRMTGRPALGSPLGLPMLTYMREVAGVGIAARRYGANWFGRGGAPAAVIAPDRDPGQQGAEALKNKIITMMHSGLPAVIPQNVKVDRWPGTTPQEAQLTDILQANATDIATFYMVPAELVGGVAGGSMTYSNIEARVLNLLVLGVSYWLTKLEKRLTRSIPGGRFVKANESAIVRTDIKTRTDVIGNELRSGTLTQNEARRLLDRQPIPDGDRIVWPPFSTNPAPAATPSQDAAPTTP